MAQRRTLSKRKRRPAVISAGRGPAPSSRGDRAARRRRRPEEAESEICDAAEGFLRERPFHALTVEEVMSRTGLSRPSFYQYFRDRNDLVVRLVDRLGDETLPMSNLWFDGTGNAETDLERGYRGVAAVWARHGTVLRALADAASQDAAVEEAYRAMMRRFVARTVARIRTDVAGGRIHGIEPEPTAEALMAMSERYLTEKLGRWPQADPDEVADTLSRIWIRTLYGTSRT